MALIDKLNAIGDAIRSKTGKTTKFTLDEMPTEIASIEGGGGVVIEKDVNFYDYDGTLLYSYTLDEAQALSDLPPDPTPPKDFLEFQEWNWTLEQIKTYEPPIDVGAIYRVIDNCTRFVVNVPAYALTTSIGVQTWSIPISVDWGDGRVDNYEGVEALRVLEHTYDVAGFYTIKADCSGKRADFRMSSGSFLGSATESTKLLEAYFAGEAFPSSSCFSNCTNLKCVTLSKNSQTGIYTKVFERCASLRCIVSPSNYTALNDRCFEWDFNLKVFSMPPTGAIIPYYGLARTGLERIGLSIFGGLKSSGYNFRYTTMIKAVIPDNFSEIPVGAFYESCYLFEVVIGENVSKIGVNAFLYSSLLSRVCLKPTTPPTLGNTNSFGGINANCIFYVPKGCLEAYQTATNWSTYASQMREEE